MDTERQFRHWLLGQCWLGLRKGRQSTLCGSLDSCRAYWGRQGQVLRPSREPNTACTVRPSSHPPKPLLFLPPLISQADGHSFNIYLRAGLTTRMNLDTLLPSRAPTFREEVAPRQIIPWWAGTEQAQVCWRHPGRMGHPPEGHSQG